MGDATDDHRGAQVRRIRWARTSQLHQGRSRRQRYLSIRPQWGAPCRDRRIGIDRNGYMGPGVPYDGRVSDVPTIDVPTTDASDKGVVELRPPSEDSWVGLSAGPLPTNAATLWATVPSCGAIVTFVGAARDHAPGRDGVDLLTYEAYEQAAVSALAALDREIRHRWPEVVRVALLHRIGELSIGDSAVVVVVSSPHRDAAFDAARFGIDAVKSTVPIWKRERWAEGESWGLEAQHLEDVSTLAVRSGQRR